MGLSELINLMPESTDAVLILSPENRFYFTGFASSDGCLIISREKSLFLSDGRYSEAAAKKISVCETAESSDFCTRLGEFFASQNLMTVAVEAEKITAAELRRYRDKFGGMEFIDDGTIDKVIGMLRSLKSERELECIKAAQEIAEDAFMHILGFISPGQTECDVALELEYYMLSHGAQAVSFETIAVSGANSSLPHGVPSEKKVEKGDFLTLDFGAVYMGYHSDMTRTVAIGRPDARMREVYDNVLAAQNAALETLRPGVLCRDVDAAAREYICSSGYGDYFPHGTGHGVGVEIHEEPALSGRSGDFLREGNVVTVEPGIYIPGEFGVRIEDMAYITKTSYINLSSSPKELIVV